MLKRLKDAALGQVGAECRGKGGGDEMLMALSLGYFVAAKN
jgi:hypothetical protein